MDMAGFLFRGHMTSPAQGTRMHGVECRVVFRGRPGPVALNYTVKYYGHEVSCSRVAAGVGVPYTTVLALPYVHRLGRRWCV